MAFAGWLIKIGGYTVPFEYIKYNTYQAYLNTLDLDSYRDANGYEHRNALAHKPPKAEWETPPLTNSQFAELMRNISLNYTIATERTASVTMYIPETDSYVTGDMYMPDPKPTIYDINDDNVILYNPIRIAWIGK